MLTIFARPIIHGLPQLMALVSKLYPTERTRKKVVRRQGHISVRYYPVSTSKMGAHELRGGVGVYPCHAKSPKALVGIIPMALRGDDLKVDGCLAYLERWGALTNRALHLLASTTGTHLSTKKSQACR